MATGKQPPPHSDAAVQAYNAIVDRYKNESDRAAAILAASHLEVVIEWVLRAYLVDAKVTRDLFDSNGPLATFSGRFKLAYAMGLMQDSALHDFDTVRKIRNHFAHNVNANAFYEQPVSQWCASLAVVKWPGLPPEQSHRDEPARTQFLMCVAGMSAWADWTLDRLRSGELTRRVPPPESERFGTD